MIAQLDWRYIKTRPLKVLTRIISYIFFEGRPLTTRGRWINPLVFMLFRFIKFFPNFNAIYKPIFILGTGRSGTTVLGVVFSMHKDIAYLNEPKALWHALHPNEDLIGNYTSDTARYRFAESDVTKEIQLYARKIYGTFLKVTFSRRVLDKYPELIFRVPFVKSIFPDAKFIFLVRNGWDTCSSIKYWSERLGKNDGDKTNDWWGVDKRKWKYLVEQLVPEDPELFKHIDSINKFENYSDMAAVEWIITMREGLRLMKEYPNDILRVNYENLCSNTYNELLRIVDFLELQKVDDKFYKYAESTLRPTPSKDPFPLDPCVENIFIKTMGTLGYVT